MALPSLIAIDGPVAVGKSTVGKMLAKRLGYLFVDTGIMYRALTWKAIKQDIPLEEEKTLTHLANEAKIELNPPAADFATQNSSVLIDGKDITQEVRLPEVERGVSLVSKIAGVRTAMVAQQQRIAQRGKVVMVGRDIGTVVLPQAELIVFLQASAEERARRRYRELLALGEKANYQEVLAELKRRDDIDSNRAISPLRPAPMAKIIDTDMLTAEQVVEAICALAEST